MPLMLFSKDFIIHGDTEMHTGCAFENSVCNSRSINIGKTWGVVDLSFKFDTDEKRAENLARTLSHELGHMVSI